jgi:CelD/BcsL family acetyltransferase involved in cellulose biosynthesis
MRISELVESERSLWDAYVRRSRFGLPQHQADWQKVLQRTYGYDTNYLMAWQQDATGGKQVTGVLPLFVLSMPLGGCTVTTPPGGLCAEDEETARALLEQGEIFARQVRAKQLILHDSRQEWAWPAASYWQSESAHECWLVDVRAGEDELWQGLDRNIRRQVRIAQRNELRVEIDRTGARLDDFYAVLSRFTHQAGTPVFGRNFLYNLIELFPEGYNIVVVYSGNEPVGGYFQLEMGNTIFGAWGATLHHYLELRPVYLAYWQIILDTWQRGFAYLDMGRSPRASNASNFKGQWNGRSTPVYQQMLPLAANQNGGSVAVRAQADRSFRSFRALWPKLPFPVAQFLGPRLRRHIPFA